MPTRAQARSHYEGQRRVSLRAVAAVRAAFKRSPRVETVARIVSAYQLASATRASRTIAGFAGSAETLARPAAFAGYTSAGFPVAEPLETILASLTADLDRTAADMLAQLDRFVVSEVADAGRAASQAEFVARPDWTNYVRMLNPPSCSRCAILAGRIYRDLDAFLRHPGCDCVMVPVTDWEEAHDEGLLSSAEVLFEKGQIRGLSKADAQAVTDGANISQVVRAAQGMATADVFNQRGLKVTTAGTTKRSAWRKANPNRPYRLRPEAIYANAKDRDDAIRLLKLFGYIN